MTHGWPVDPNTRISQAFGGGKASYQPDGHTGMDFAMPKGQPVYAVADGTVLHASWSKELGWPNPYYISPDFTPNDGIDQSAGIVVVIDHGSFVSISAHLDSEGLNNGDRVTRGQIIGRSGNTGFSSGPHLHFEILPDKWNVHAKYYGRVNPLNYISKEVAAPVVTAVAGDQRITNSVVNYRDAPNTGAGIITKFPKDVILDFKGFITNGQPVEDNSVWFVGKHTNGYAWSGGFINSSTDGLPNLTPAAPPAPEPTPAPALAADQRITNAPVNYRTAPKIADNLIKEFPKDVILDFKGFITNGDNVESNSVWFVGKHTDGYAWSGGFIDSSTNGLTNLTVATPAPTAPVYVPPVLLVPTYTFEKDLDCITEVIPAGEGNFERGNFPAKPTHAVFHDYGTHGRDTYESAVAHFKRGNRDKPSSAHVIISWDHITQMVSFDDRAYGAGPAGNNYFQVEIDPEIFTGSEKGKKVLANVILFYTQLCEKYGYKITLIEHNQIMPTLCGDDIDLAWFADIDHTVAPVSPVTAPASSITAQIADHFEALAKLFRKL